MNHFCVSFVEDTLQINSIGLYNVSQETSIDNRQTNEASQEAEQSDTEKDVREPRANATQTPDRIGNKEHPVAEADSLRTWENREPTIREGYGNKEDTLKHDTQSNKGLAQNNEPPCPTRTAEEIKSIKLATGKTEQEKGLHINMLRKSFMSFLSSQN